MKSWNGKKKAVTFSYDDGVISDCKFLEIINSYGIKCTFNLNSQVLGTQDVWQYKDFEVKRLPKENLIELYKGHEIAVHGEKHLHLPQLSKKALEEEIGNDKVFLEKLFKTQIHGMAYPFGEYNNEVIDVLKKYQIKYARTVNSNHKFSLQENLLEFQPTCHHADKEIFYLIDEFLNSDSLEPQLFYIWGHSYEFDGDKNWSHLEEICKKLSGKSDIFYGTNWEVFL